MKINKITVGYVIQTYDTETKAWTEQEFIAGDEVNWEDDHGDYTDPLDVYLPFNMKQP